jgi:hypothetical protein
MLAHKLREVFEFWIMPIVNPDGVIVGNYRCNLQGKDMNRHWFADDDEKAEEKGRCHEVELIRSYLKRNLPEDSKKYFPMFLDVHAHSSQTSIFIYACLPDNKKDVDETRKITAILD